MAHTPCIKYNMKTNQRHADLDTPYLRSVDVHPTSPEIFLEARFGAESAKEKGGFSAQKEVG